jgi:hypothetical protein
MTMDVDAFYYFGYDVTDDVAGLDEDDSYDGDFETYAGERWKQLPDTVEVASTDVYGNHVRYFVHISALSMTVDWNRTTAATQPVDGSDLDRLADHMRDLNDALQVLGLPTRDGVPSRILVLDVD